MPETLRFKNFLLSTALAILWVTALTIGCTTSDRQSELEADLSPEEKKSLDEYKAEIEIGRNMAGRLLAFYGTNGNDRLIGYLNQVGNYVASYGDYPDRRYMFAILETESINAFACPGGYILITQGAIREATSEAELAAILGHEVTHVGRKHMFDTLKSMREQDMEKASAARGKADVDSTGIKMRRRPKVDETGAGAAIARYLSGSAGAGLNILKAAQAGMSLIMEKGLDKRLEYEADHEGVKYAIRAGYEPKAMIAYLKRLDDRKKANNKGMKTLERTHPSFKSRMKRIAQLLKTLKADEIIGATGRGRFKKMHKLMPEPKET